MAEEEIKWTDQQRRAIVARGSDVLVTASAGTGKTAVLSGRCVHIISDKGACPDVQNMLVLTFTDMAAEQMRSRIAERLNDEFDRSRDRHLRHQLVLLQGADISTIHSFCKRLITQYFHELDLDPTFSVIDADEARLLKAEVLEKTINWAWGQDDIVQGLEQLLRRRDLRANDGFLGKIVQLSGFLDGVVSRQNWYERAARLAEAIDPSTSDLGRKQKQLVADRLRDIAEQLRHAQKLYENEVPGGGWAAKFEEAFVQPVANCLELIDAGDWDQCAREIRDFQKPRFSKPKELPKTLAELIHKAVGRAFDSFGKLSSLAVLNPDYLDKVGRAVTGQTRVLIELVEKFDELYSRAKRTLNCLDFADLEHYALRLLTEEGPQDNLPPSATALALRRRYKYIFVDEYQDINPVQQAILDALSSGDNVFVVGDVKQSIYAWRGAEPQIFLDRLKPTSPDRVKTAKGLRVDLNANWRSAKGILDFVNKLFSRIMTVAFTKIDYDESARLKPALTAESATGTTSYNKRTVEFHILDEKAKDNASSGVRADGDDTPDVVTSRRRQAAMIARRIRQMVGAETGKAEFRIYDKQQDAFRDVEYRNIVVLMRSLAKKANDYVEVLRLAGVPVSCQATAGYFEATEISDMLCLLKVLDNPQRDIELAAVLRSPFFNVADTELAKIKMHNKTNQGHESFYNRLVEYSKSGPDTELGSAIAEHLAQIEQWRTAARRGNLADLIWQIYRRTNYLSFVSALPTGQARRANLLKLHDRAVQFEGFVSSAGIPSLRRFVEFIEKLQETGQDWAPAEPTACAGNAVRILSVHKSKGLEFPVVFLAELESKFNTRDIYADCLADAGDTLGLQIIERRSNSKLRSLAHEVIAEKKLATTLAEEMRILYVATTRARERLILTASQKHKTCRQIITNGFYLGGKAIPAWLLAGCRTPLDWILYGFSDQKALHDAFETELGAEGLDDGLFSFKFHGQAELKKLSAFVTNLKVGRLKRHHPDTTRRIRRTKDDRRQTMEAASAKGNREIINNEIINNQLSIIKESLAWRYGFGDAPRLPAKTSVSELTHRSDEYAKFDYSRAFDRRPACLLAGEADMTKPVEPRLIGSATHLVIAALDLTGPVTRETIEKAKEKLLAESVISPSVAERLNTDSIQAFFETDLGRLALDEQNQVLQEWPFTFALPASEWNDSDDARDTRCAIRNTHDAIRDTTGGSLKRSLGMAPTDTFGASRDTRYAIRDTIIVQGIIDMLIRTPQDLVVVDFKTDKITADQAPRRAELYRPQLNRYAKAASAILKSPSTAKWLYFLTPRCAIKLR
ncbi:MAG: helicase-exonuclease AddAB subunit AddA [Planctomycetes bacterium]|nr:helicase-exonuclease AddAB subunit AddA [Planctomycetota bacterium]